jgi:hypothetical protein
VRRRGIVNFVKFTLPVEIQWADRVASRWLSHGGLVIRTPPTALLAHHFVNHSSKTDFATHNNPNTDNFYLVRPCFIGIRDT